MPTFEFAPVLWWGAPLVAAPVVIHLITLVRQRRVKWAAMEFLLASQRKYRSRVLLRQLLLLALRTLAVAALVAGLARPRWTQAVGLGGAAGAAHVVILDDSASMADTSGGGEVVADAAAGDTRRATAFDRGRAVVERLAGELAAAGDRQRLAVAVTSRLGAAGDAAACLVPLAEVTPDRLQEIRDTLARATAGESAAGPREACGAVQPLLAAAGAGPRVLWIVGDFRGRDWLAGDEPAGALRQAAAGGASIRLVDCAEDPGGNLAVQRLDVVGGVPAVNVLLPVEVEIRNDGATPARDVAVELREDGGGRPGVRIDEIPAGGTATRRFDVRFPAVGSHSIEAGIVGDVLAPDDVRWTTVDVSERIDVLVVDGGATGTEATAAGDGFYVATALAPGSGAATGLRPRIVPPAALATTDLRRFESLWLLDVERLDPAALAAVETYAREGGGVVFFCGPRTRADVVAATLHRGGAGIFPVPLAGAVDLLPAVPPVPDVVVDDHPVVAVLAGQRNPLLDAVRVERFWAVDRGFDAAALGVRRMLSLRTGQPLAVERTFGAGTVVAVLTSAAPVWNNWARANPSWVVVLLELEGHLARFRRRTETPSVGDPLVVRLEAGVDEPDVDVLVPPDAAVVRQTAASVPGPALEARLAETTRAGLYEARWRRLDGTDRRRSIAVNVDPDEGRLERVGRRRLEAALRGVPFHYDAAGAVVTVAGAATGRPLTIPLVVLAAALLACEQFVAFRAGYHPVARGTGA